MSNAAKITPIGIGGILVTDNAVATLLPTQDAWVKVVVFDEVQQDRGAVEADPGDNDLTATRAGIYEIIAPVSFTDSSQKTYEICIGINDVPQEQTRARVNFNSATDTRFVVPYGILTLALGDVIALFARCIDANTQQVVVEDCTLSGKLLLLLPTL